MGKAAMREFPGCLSCLFLLCHRIATDVWEKKDLRFLDKLV